MFGNLGNLMKQIQQAQERAQALQAELAEKRFAASAGGGLVTGEVDGLGELLEVTLDGARLGLDDETRELLQDAIVVAVNEALRQVQEEKLARVKDLTGGLSLPPGFEL